MKSTLISITLLLVINTSVLAYELIDLGANVEPKAINNLGVIVGSSNTNQFPATAFRWSSNNGYELIDGTSANAVNDNGMIAGSTITGAFTLDGNSYRNWKDYGALGINQWGVVAGYNVGENPVQPVSLPYNPALLDSKKWNIFDIAGIYPRGTQEGVYADRYILNSINTGGYTVGYKYRYGLAGSAAILIDPEVTINDKTDVTYLALPVGGRAADINDNNMIVGTTGSSSNTVTVTYSRAYILDYNMNHLTVLPVLDGGLRSNAYDINVYNQVVGSSEIQVDSSITNHAFLWNYADGVNVDLNDWATNGWTLISATAINDNGDIVGTGTFNGIAHGFLLTFTLPNEPVPAPTPTPTPAPAPAPVQQPIANDINVDTEFNSALNINILANDTGNDGSTNTASIEIVQNSSHGQSAIISNGIVVYTPDAGYSGMDSFTYIVKDKNGVLSNVASVNISVNAKAMMVSNDVPTSESNGALNPLVFMWLMIIPTAYRLRAKVLG
jgi:probable HAF family extracellular repeat protein